MDSTVIAAIIGATITFIGITINTIMLVKNIKYQKRMNQETLAKQSEMNRETLETQTQNLFHSIQEENNRLEKSFKNELEISKKNLAIEHITDKRVNWMSEVRVEMSQFIASSHFITDKFKLHPEKPISSSDYMDLYKYASKLKLLFNIKDGRDISIIRLLDKICNHLSPDNTSFDLVKFNEECDSLIRETRIYLKLEWERVKIEISEDITKQQLELRLQRLEDELNVQY